MSHIDLPTMIAPLELAS